MEGRGMSTSRSEVKEFKGVKIWQPVITLRRLELRGLESVQIIEDYSRPSGKVSVSRKGSKQIQGRSTGVRSPSGKIEKKSKLQSVWILPDESISFGKPQQKFSLRQPSLMLKQKIVTTGSNPGQSQGFVMPLWKPYSNVNKVSSKRKKTVPVKLDSILTQIKSSQVLDDDQVVEHLKVSNPEAMPQGKVTWTGIMMLPRTYGASSKNLMEPMWKNPKVFFEGTVFEPIFQVPDNSEQAANSQAQQPEASFPESSPAESSCESSQGQRSSEFSASAPTAVRNRNKNFQSYEEFRSTKAGELRKTIPKDMRKAEPQWVTDSEFKFLINCNILGSRTRISDGQSFYIAGSEYEPEAGAVVNEFFPEIDPEFGQFGKGYPNPDLISNIPKTTGNSCSR